MKIFSFIIIIILSNYHSNIIKLPKLYEIAFIFGLNNANIDIH